MIGRVLVVALATLSVAAAEPPVKAHTVVTLADGVHAIVWDEPLQDPIEPNVVIVVNEDDVVVVDSAFLPSTARFIVSTVKRITPKPVRFVVNTHWHNDHVQANEVYQQAWPAVSFIGHTTARVDAAEQAFGQIGAGRKMYGDQIATWERWLAAGKDDKGVELTDQRRARITGVLAYYRRVMDETAAIRPVPPDVTVDDRLVLHRSTRTIEVRHLGRGNTRGDVVVFLPKEKIVATGDLVSGQVPFGFGSYYAEWATTLSRMKELGAEVYVPGHGAVLRGQEHVESIRGTLSALTTEVAAAVKRGESLEQVRAAVKLAEWKDRLSRGNPAIAATFEGNFLQPAVERAWRQARGEADALK